MAIVFYDSPAAERVTGGYPLPKPSTPIGGVPAVFNDLPSWRPIPVGEPTVTQAPALPPPLVAPVLPRGDCGCGCAGASACGGGGTAAPTLPSLPPAGGPGTVPPTAGKVTVAEAGVFGVAKNLPWWLWLLVGLGIAAATD